MSLNIYLGQTPEQPQMRRLVRAQARALAAQFQRPTLDPTTLVLHVAPGGVLLDVLIVRPEALIAGMVYTSAGPVDVQPDGVWLAREHGQRLRGPHGETPLDHVRRGRTAFIRWMERDLASDVALGDLRLSRTIGALILDPAVHPESRIMLDIDDHRQQLKLVGLDELPSLAAMVKTGVQFDLFATRRLVEEALGARLWYADAQWLFELARAPFQLRVLAERAEDAQVLPLLEGANIVGRRRTPLHDEHRLTLADDELMSNSHAIITCAPDGQVALRDTSTNGTWIQVPDQAEEHLHNAERLVTPDTIMRMGATRVRLEAAHDQEAM